MSESFPLFVRVATSFSELTTIANDLNAVSDELGKSVAQIDEALRKLNLGVNVWHSFYRWRGYNETEGEYESTEVGYAKISGKWGISLRKVEGCDRNPEDDRIEAWLFNDAPRQLRLDAIGEIPKLLERMAEVAAKATEAIKAKLADVQAVASAMVPPPVPPPPHTPQAKRALVQRQAAQISVQAEQIAPASSHARMITQIEGNYSAQAEKVLRQIASWAGEAK